MRTFTGLFFFSFFLLGVSCTKKESPAPVPSDAVIITRVNSKEIITQIAKEKLTDFSWNNLFSTSEEDTTEQKKGWEAILKDPSEAGIDLLEDVWAFYRNSEIGIIASIEDTEELENAISQNITKNILHSEKLRAFTYKNVSAVWNKEYVLFLISEKPASEKYLFSLLSSERSLFNSPISEDDEEKEILIWNKNAYIKNFLPAHFQSMISSDSFSLTTLDFENGRISIENTDLLSNKTAFLKSVNFNSNLFKSDLLASIGISFNLSHLSIQESEFNNEFLNHCFEGTIYARADSITSLKKIFKTTELDEEFNSIEKIDTLIEYYPSYLFTLPVKNQDNAQVLLTKLEKKGLLLKENSSYKFILTEYPVYLYFQNELLFISDKEGKGLPEKASFVNTSLNSPGEYMLLKVHNSTTNLLPEQLKSISFSAIPDSGDYIKMKGSVETSLKDEYSLLTFINFIKSKSSSFIMEEPEAIQ